MAQGSARLGGHPGSADGAIPELVGFDPSVDGLSRPVGWRVMLTDGSEAWDKFGTADTDWEPIAGGPSGAVLSVNGQVGNVVTPVYTNGITTGAVQLSTLPSAGFTAGAVAWVDSGVQAPFWLVKPSVAPTVDNIMWVAATGKAGYYWERLIVPNLSFSLVTAWHIDPTNGNDENVGTSAGVGNALKTAAEWTRRMCAGNSFPSVGATVSIDNDMADADSIIVAADAAPTGSTGVTFNGSQTVVSTQTITAVQARTPASNLANTVTVSGFNFTPFVNQMLRVQGTQNYALILAALTTSTTGDTAQLSELWNTSSASQVAPGGITTVGTIIEIVHTRKGPLVFITTGRCQPSINDLNFSGTGIAKIVNTRMTSNGFAGTFVRVLMQGTTNNQMFAPSGFQVVGGGCTGPGFTCSGPVLHSGFAWNNCAASWQDATYAKVRSAVFNNSTIFLQTTIMHIDGDLGQFNLPANAIGVSLNAAGTGEGSALRFNSGSHYGGGNNASAFVWSLGTAVFVAYVSATPPTMNAGNGVRINGANVALGSLPVNLSLTTGSAVYAQ